MAHCHSTYVIQEETNMSKTKLTIVYYSATGHNYQMATWAKEAAEQEKAEVRLVRARELAPAAAIDANEAWRQHVEDTRHIPVANSDDIDWDVAIIWNVHTMFMVLSAQ